ncbi:hypothetical protein J1614_006672 [Plenodomus biglobosus]|nr:hypothetical protein J1614_006672 [Plenodomus biglobosus]
MADSSLMAVIEGARLNLGLNAVSRLWREAVFPLLQQELDQADKWRVDSPPWGTWGTAATTAVTLWGLHYAGKMAVTAEETNTSRNDVVGDRIAGPDVPGLTGGSASHMETRRDTPKPPLTKCWRRLEPVTRQYSLHLFRMDRTECLQFATSVKGRAQSRDAATGWLLALVLIPPGSGRSTPGTIEDWAVLMKLRQRMRA